MNRNNRNWLLFLLILVAPLSVLEARDCLLDFNEDVNDALGHFELNVERCADAWANPRWCMTEASAILDQEVGEAVKEYERCIR